MTKAELYEEIRALLREPQARTVAKPWTYTENDIDPQVRSVLRRVRFSRILIDAEMDVDGVFTVEPTEDEALLIAYGVAVRLLSGDLIQKLLDGEMGVTFKAGPDIIDTKGAAKTFESAADRYREEYDTILLGMMAENDVGGQAFFGDPIPDEEN